MTDFTWATGSQPWLHITYQEPGELLEKYQCLGPTLKTRICYGHIWLPDFFLAFIYLAVAAFSCSLWDLVP